METDIANCDVYEIAKEECHANTFSRIKELHNLSDLSKSDKILLKFRIAGLIDTSNGTICHHHLQKYLTFYNFERKKCCDPFNTHNKTISRDLRVISYQTCQDSFKYIPTLKLIPGDKYCKSCQNKISSLIECQLVPDSDIVVDSSSSQIHSGREFQFSHGSHFSAVSTDANFTNSSLSEDRTQIEKVLQFLGISSLLNLDSFQNKKSTAAKIIEEVIAKVSEKLSSLLKINVPISNNSCEKLLENTESLHEIIQNLQKEFEKATVEKKIEILSLLPKNWKYPQILKYFECSEYMHRKLSELNRNIGENKILKKRYNKIPPVVQDLIKKYYVDDSNCRVCPGKKDFVAVADSSGKKIFIQKKLLLYTVNDLYNNFIEDYRGRYNVLPKLSYFAALRPRECIVAGDPGSHTICVCEVHENIRMKLSSWDKNLKYRDCFEIACCSTNEIKCMLHRCIKCPGIEAIRKKINDCCLKEVEYISYKCWVNEGSRASLKSVTEKLEDFKMNLANELWNLSIHHFIADAQKFFFLQCKEKLMNDTCILVMDFSENYSFIIQNSVQAFYYNNSQATIHPFLMYYKRADSKELQNMSFCVISDTKDHFAYTVYAFISKITDILKDEFPWIKQIIYFSDGAPTQYKNKNHLANMCSHEKDFQIKVKSYNFFATSHGKTACDGIGGTVKRTVMRHCLRSSPENQVTTPLEMFEYVSKGLSTVRSVWVPDKDVKNCETALRERFSRVKTIPNTRKYHCFIPTGDNTLNVKITSSDDKTTPVTLNI